MKKAHCYDWLAVYHHEKGEQIEALCGHKPKLGEPLKRDTDAPHCEDCEWVDNYMTEVSEAMAERRCRGSA